MVQFPKSLPNLKRWSYSLFFKVIARASLAKAYGYSSVALCDINVLHGAMEFRHACEKQGIKPIYGMEIFCTLEPEKEQVGFVLLAKNDAGFQQPDRRMSDLKKNLDGCYDMGYYVSKHTHGILSLSWTR